MGDSTEEYWTQRYREGLTGWDIGYASPALMKYCEQLALNTQILIPGAGNAYEWVALKELGFTNVSVIDISGLPIERLKLNYPQWAHELIHGDFFEHQGAYDLILEQTFFCALSPKLRAAYVQHMNNLLKPNGALVGLLFNRNFEKEGPPYGGEVQEYESLFKAAFSSFVASPCNDSIPERAGSELFFKASGQ
jgi:SAM-dependent methyltransferase